MIRANLTCANHRGSRRRQLRLPFVLFTKIIRLYVVFSYLFSRPIRRNPPNPHTAADSARFLIYINNFSRKSTFSFRIVSYKCACIPPRSILADFLSFHSYFYNFSPRNGQSSSFLMWRPSAK